MSIIEFIYEPAQGDLKNEFAIAAKNHTMAIMLFDIHVHTALSPCGNMKIQDVIARAGKRGLDGVCITDHQTMDIRHVIAEGVQENGLCVLFGMEYTTPQGDFLLFGPFEELAPNLSAEKLLAMVHDQGGAAVAAHPFRQARPADERIVRNGLCHAVEVINGRNTPFENSAVGKWRRYGLTRCGGSDAHTLNELGTFATRFLVPIQTRGDLIQALRKGLCRPEIPEVRRNQPDTLPMALQ
jgi:predicted metal-dependent phosphoesterase TrpH